MQGTYKKGNFLFLWANVLLMRQEIVRERDKLGNIARLLQRAKFDACERKFMGAGQEVALLSAMSSAAVMSRQEFLISYITANLLITALW